MKKSKQVRVSLIALLISFVFVMACDSTKRHEDSSVKKIAKKSSNPNNLKLNLKQNMKVQVSTWSLSEDQEEKLSKQNRQLSVTELGGVDGLSFIWQEGELDQGNQISLPNIAATRKMLLPLFWPRGELYLSDYASIWLSDAAFEELLRTGKTHWSLGIDQNPLLGPAQEDTTIKTSLKNLNQWIKELSGLTNQTTQKKFEFNYLTVLTPSQNYSLKLNQKTVQVEVIEAGNDLFRYKILNNPQNPLILEFELAPNLPTVSMAGKNLFLLKSLLEYRIKEIETE